MKDNAITIGVSIISLILSVTIIGYLCSQGGCSGIKNISFGDTSVAVLGAIVGLLVGWQIYNALDLNKKVKDLEGLYNVLRKDIFNEMNDFKSALDKKSEDSIKEIKNENSIYNKKIDLKVSSYFMVSLAVSDMYPSPKFKIPFLISSLNFAKEFDDSLVPVVLGIWKDILLNNKDFKVSKQEKEEWLCCLEGIDTKEAIELRAIINSLKER